MTFKVFILGATGLIGGDLLYALKAAQPKWQVTALVRNEAKGKHVTNQYPDVKPVFGSLDSLSLLEEQAAQSDLVYTCANIDHIESTRAVLRGLQSRKTPSFLVHTSGAGILTWETRDLDAFGQGLDRTYDDLAGVKDLVSLPDRAFHRDVEKVVLEAHGAHPNIHTAIVCPPLIYGVGRGPGNQNSVQANLVAHDILKRGKGFTMCEGKNAWNYVHVRDLSNLFVLLGEAAAKGDVRENVWDAEGYYLTEQGLIVFQDLAKAVVEDADKRGLLKSTEIDSLEPDEVAKFSPDFGVYCGTNSRGTANRGREVLGWKQTHSSLLQTIPDVVELEAKKLGLLK